MDPLHLTACASDRKPRTPAWVAWLWLGSMLLTVTACESRRQAPAERAIAEIEAVLTEAGTAPAKYIPGELADVRAKLEELEHDYDARRYETLLTRAPAILAAARALAPTAAARAAELDRALRDEWATLAEAVPSELTVVADRFDRLATGRKLPSGVSRDDVLGARGRLRDALALWDRARQEAEAGRLPEAVTLAHQVRGLGRSVDVVSPPAAAPVE